MLANNTPTVFSDEDLNEWKERDHCDECGTPNKIKLAALINRLEAAENCIQIADDEGFSDKCIEAHNEWLKLRGK